jgi:hypothetical protein
LFWLPHIFCIILISFIWFIWFEFNGHDNREFHEWETLDFVSVPMNQKHSTLFLFPIECLVGGIQHSDVRCPYNTDKGSERSKCQTRIIRLPEPRHASMHSALAVQLLTPTLSWSVVVFSMMCARSHGLASYHLSLPCWHALITKLLPHTSIGYLIGIHRWRRIICTNNYTRCVLSNYNHLNCRNIVHCPFPIG